MSTSIDVDLAFAIAAARDAGHRLAGLRATERWEGKTLGDVGDQAADGFLRGLLEGRYPEDGVLSEETKDSPERLQHSRVWVVDPLDGTKEYRAVRKDWAVHVALTIDKKVVLGAVALPSLDSVLWGVCGDDPRAGVEGTLQSMTRGDSESPAKPRVAVSRSHTPPWVEKFTETMGGEMLRWGSVGFKVSRLLTGEADLYVHKVGLKEWDTCAPEAVARALGWHVCKLRGEEHTYNRPDPKNHELVICRPQMKDKVLEAIASCGALED